MGKKWYATIKANDEEKGKIIKIGIIKIEDEYTVVTDAFDDKRTVHSTTSTKTKAESDIYVMWGRWNTFTWIEA